MVESKVKPFEYKGYTFMLVPTERKDLLNYRLWFFNPLEKQWEKTLYCESMKQAKKLAYKFLRYHFLT